LRTPLAGLRLQLATALAGPDANLRPAITTAIQAAPAQLPDELRRDHHGTLADHHVTWPSGARAAQLPSSRFWLS